MWRSSCWGVSPRIVFRRQCFAKNAAFATWEVGGVVNGIVVAVRTMNISTIGVVVWGLVRKCWSFWKSCCSSYHMFRMVRMKDQEFILWCNLGRKLRTSSGFFGGDDPETFPVGWVETALPLWYVSMHNCWFLWTNKQSVLNPWSKQSLIAMWKKKQGLITMMWAKVIKYIIVTCCQGKCGF